MQIQIIYSPNNYIDGEFRDIIILSYSKWSSGESAARMVVRCGLVILVLPHLLVDFTD